MPDPGPGKSDWTLRTLFDFFQHRMDDADRRYEQRFQAQQEALQVGFTAQEKAVSAALQSADRAVNKAELAAEKRFEAGNEFRESLSDQSKTLLPRAEYQVQHTALAERLTRLETMLATMAGGTRQLEMTGTKVMWVVGLGVAVLLALASLLWPRN